MLKGVEELADAVKVTMGPKVNQIMQFHMSSLDIAFMNLFLILLIIDLVLRSLKCRIVWSRGVM